MKRPIYPALAFLASWSLLSCKSFDPQLLRPVEQIENRLPPLEVQIDQVSLETAYSLGKVESGFQEYEKEITKGFTISIASARNQAFLDKRIQHAVVIFDRELSDNICEPEGKKYGYAVCRIANQKSSIGWGWLIPSVLTVFTINLFGFPLYSETTGLDVEVEILDAQNNRVAKYSALAENTKHIALFWGYWGEFIPQKDADNDLTRTTNAYALRAAMENIKHQIARDAIKIRSKLIEVGELSP